MHTIMSISNLTNIVTGNSFDLFCKSLTCGNMAVNSFSVATATINNIIQGTAVLNLSRLLSDGSTFSVVSGDNIINPMIVGGALTRLSAGGIRSATGVVNSFPVGGFENSACLVVQNLLVPPTEQALICCANDGVDYSIYQLLQQGINTSAIIFDNTNGIQINSSIALQLQGTVIVFPAFVSSNPSSALVVNNSGVLSTSRLEQTSFPLTVTNVNRITASTQLPSFYFTVGGLCQCQYAFQITIGAGAGNPNMLVDLPILPFGGNFSTDSVVGTGSVYDVAETTVVGIIVQAETPGGVQVRIQIPNALAGTYFVKVIFAYSI